MGLSPVFSSWFRSSSLILTVSQPLSAVRARLRQDSKFKVVLGLQRLGVKSQECVLGGGAMHKDEQVESAST